VGRGLGALAWLVLRRDRCRALEHLSVAFPELPEGERLRLARASFRHLGVTTGEILWLFRRDCRAVNRHVRIEGMETVRSVRDSGRPIVYVTGHCGNWELMAAACNCNGLGITVVVRGLDEEPLQRLVDSFRSRFGTHAVERGGARAARELLRGLRDGALGMLIDQDTKVDGVWVPFFGRPAHTPVGAAKLALRRNVATVPLFIERHDDGSHTVHLHEPLDLPDDETAATALMTETIEAQIRRRPEQRVWLHRRWRTQPAAETAPATKAGG
jgi:KDO2-lipid IV(A) lauroyltransferase